MDPQLQDAVSDVRKQATARKVTKFVVGLVVGHCAAVTAKNIVRHVHPETESKAEQAKLDIGTYAIGGAVALKARKVIDHDVDDLFDILSGVRRAFKQTPASTVVQGEVIPDTTPSE